MHRDASLTISAALGALLVVLPIVGPSAQGTRSAASGGAAARGVATGRVLDAGGVPIAGAEVSVPQWGLADTTDGDGRWRIEGLPNGAWVLRARLGGASTSTLRTVRTRAGTPARQMDIVLAGAEAAVACAASTATRSSGASRFEVRWHPEQPVQGSAVDLEVVDAPGARPTGSLAGEPLHFTEVEPGRFRAVGAIPIDSAGSLALALRRGDGTEELRTMALSTGDYRLEKLAVAPRFGTPPTPAVQRRMDAEGALAREVSRASHASPRQWHAPFLVPREARITSGFGHGREFNGVVQSRHMGVDYAGAVGAPVRVANRGIVALVGDFYLAGTAVYIDHGEGLVTGYFHLSRADVAIGDTVARGQVIGAVGQTGRVTGPHLHWIARYGHVSVDARTLLALETRPDATTACRERTSR